MGAESVEEVGIITAKFDVLQAVAVAEGVVSEVEDMIGFMVRQMEFEQMKTLIDGVDESDAPSEQMESADTAVGNAMHAVGDFVMDVAGGEGGSRGIEGFGFIEPTLNTALVSVELNSYLGNHSKSLSAGGDEVWLHHQTPQKRQGISSFQNISRQTLVAFAWLRTSWLGGHRN